MRAPPPFQIAASLRAEKLILMTDVPGVLRNKDDPSTKVHCCCCPGGISVDMRHSTGGSALKAIHQVCCSACLASEGTGI